MANYSDFMVFVDWEEFDKAKTGDIVARQKIADELNGVDIYFHAFVPPRSGMIGVTIADVICAGIIQRVVLHKDA